MCTYIITLNVFSERVWPKGFTKINARVSHLIYVQHHNYV